MRIQDTRTWKQLEPIDAVFVYEMMKPTFEEKVFYTLMWINPIGFGIMLADKLKYKGIINQIKQQIQQGEKT